MFLRTMSILYVSTQKNIPQMHKDSENFAKTSNW